MLNNFCSMAKNAPSSDIIIIIIIYANDYRIRDRNFVCLVELTEKNIQLQTFSH